MRPVKVEGTPPQAWVDEADKVTKELRDAAGIAIPETYELQLLPDLAEIAEMPIAEVNTLAIGEIAGKLALRVFFEQEQDPVTIREPKKVREGGNLSQLKGLLMNNWDAAELKPLEKRAVFDLSAAIVRSDRIDAIIDKNEGLWRDDRIRNWLLGMFNNKCWYSEAQDSVSSVHVDHYRPKGRVSDDLTGESSAGYWWLAFNWSNYKICGQLLNVKKRDVFPFASAHRGNADEPDSIDLESPILIDPRTDQTRLISYELQDEENCVAVVAGDVNTEDAIRADRTIEIIGLNRLRTLNSKRAALWDKCRMAIVDYQNAGGAQPLRQISQAAARVKLKQMIQYGEEFSSVAEACVNKLAPAPLRAAVFDAAA